MATVTASPPGNGPLTIWPAFQLSFDYNGNNYNLSILPTNNTDSTSADIETAVSSMANALTTGYSNVHLYEFAMDETVII